jgi:hypothetical protein
MTTLKVTVAFGLAFGVWVGSAVEASAAERSQNCSGVMKEDSGDYSLNPDAGSGLWCDALLSEEFSSVKGLTQKVLKVCPVGSHCRIKGGYEGHGVFYWSQVTSVQRLPDKPSADTPEALRGSWQCVNERPSPNRCPSTGLMKVTLKDFMNIIYEAPCTVTQVSNLSENKWRIVSGCPNREVAQIWTLNGNKLTITEGQTFFDYVRH